MTQSVYDGDGNVVQTINPLGHTWTFVYDTRNRKVQEIEPSVIDAASGNTVAPTLSWSYDAAGNATAVIDARGHETDTSYDAANRVTEIDAPAVPVAAGGTARPNTHTTYDLDGSILTLRDPNTHTTTNTYDLLGRLLTTTDAAGDVAYHYDALNRIISETSNGKTHAYVYDLAGNRLKTTYGGTDRLITSTYDNLNRLSTMTESGRTTSYGYDVNGNIAQKTLPNGDVETSSFDALNRTGLLAAQTGAAVSLYSYQYTYDLVGNVQIIVETYPGGLNNRTVTNTYDNANRLHVEAVTGSAPNVTTTYEYDAANNRTSMAVANGSGTVTTSYTVNNLNQTTSSTDGTRTETWTYDDNGNASTCVVTGGSDNGTDTYSYDYENRLVGLVKGTAGGAGTYAYSYDYRTRRIARDESSASGVVTHLVFSGGTSVQEYDGSNTTPTVEYIRGSDYGGGVGGVLYTLRTVSGTLTPSYTHANGRGDVIAQTDSSGSLTWQGQYEAFGKTVQENGATLDRQKSNSKDTDPTGLVDEGNRYRRGCVFLTRDPAGFVDGPNLYCYVNQNPWTHFDPEGLAADDITDPEALGTMQAGRIVTGAATSVYEGIKEDATLAHQGAVVATSDKTTPTQKIMGAAVAVAAVVDVGTMVTPEGGAESVAGHTVAKDVAKSVAKDVAEGTTKDAGKEVAATTAESSAKKTNQEVGADRHAKTDAELKAENPGKSVQSERMLRDADGKKVVDPETGEGRRVDHAVIDQEAGTAKTYETTGRNVDKTKQLAKEDRVREAGGTYIRDKETKKMIPVEKPSEVRRQD